MPPIWRPCRFGLRTAVLPAMMRGMTTAAVSPRPARIQFQGHTADDGLFGPDSVTWRIASLPQYGVGAYAAAVVQMLYPPVMHMIDQASSVRRDPGKRGELTALFGRTLTYGDTATATHAAEVLRKIHHAMKATDPVTGETYSADKPNLALWVHNTIQWCTLRALELWGPELSEADKDRLLREQLIAATLVNCVEADVPVTYAALNDYIEGMTPLLAYGSDTIWFKQMMLPTATAWNPKSYGPGILTMAVMSVLNKEQRELYGFSRPDKYWVGLNKLMRGVLQGEERKIPVLERIRVEREKLDTEAFGSHRRPHSA